MFTISFSLGFCALLVAPPTSHWVQTRRSLLPGKTRWPPVFSLSQKTPMLIEGTTHQVQSISTANICYYIVIWENSSNCQVDVNSSNMSPPRPLCSAVCSVYRSCVLYSVKHAEEYREKEAHYVFIYLKYVHSFHFSLVRVSTASWFSSMPFPSSAPCVHWVWHGAKQNQGKIWADDNFPRYCKCN